jgi:hypothetical protein
MLDDRSFWAADCDTDHYLVVAKLGRVWQWVNKGHTDLEKPLSRSYEVEGKEQYHVEVSNRFAALEDLDSEVDINSASETIRENIKISAKESPRNYELKKNKPWFDEGCLKLLEQKKQAQFQWLQQPSQINGGTLNNIT